MHFFAILVQKSTARGDPMSMLCPSFEELMLAIDGSFDGIWINDAGGHILYFNKACESFFGIKLDHARGKHVSIMQANGIIDSPAMLQALIPNKRVNKIIIALKTDRQFLTTCNQILRNGRSKI